MLLRVEWLMLRVILLLCNGTCLLFLDLPLRILGTHHRAHCGMTNLKALTNLSVQNGDDKDRYGVLNEKCARRVDGLPISDRPLLVTVL